MVQRINFAIPDVCGKTLLRAICLACACRQYDHGGVAAISNRLLWPRDALADRSSGRCVWIVGVTGGTNASAKRLDTI